MRSLQTLTMVLLLGSGATAAELTRIERGSPASPFDAHATPGWCLLVFGPDAQTRVWLAVDDDCLCFDRNANGSLTDDDKVYRSDRNQPFILGPFTDPATKVRYPHLQVRVSNRSGGPDLISINVLVPGKYEQHVRPSPLGTSPKTAPIIHLDGPLSVGLLVRKPRVGLVELQAPSDITFTPGSRQRVVIYVGSKNLGDQTMPTCVMSCGEGDLPVSLTLPASFYPTSEFRFPNVDPRGPPTIVRQRLDDD